MADSGIITGVVEPGFEAVRDAVASNFEQGSEVGAAFCAHIGLGFWRSSPVTLFGGEGSFGHGGAGGSYGFADPEHGLAGGCVMNNMAMEEFTGDTRSHGLIRAVYEAIGTTPKYF